MTCAPWASLKNTGVPPTFRKARTGLDTPAGIKASARAYSSAERANDNLDGFDAGNGGTDEFVTGFSFGEFLR
jgi:hypothetical protein